jgi:hypothetical protein
VSRSSFIVGPAGRKVGLLGDWWRWGKLAVVVLIFLEGVKAGFNLTHLAG